MTEHREERRKVKVRIACAVNAEGEWNAIGWSPSGDYCCKAALEGLASAYMNEAVHWITAEVPVPEMEEIIGQVEEATP